MRLGLAQQSRGSDQVGQFTRTRSLRADLECNGAAILIGIGAGVVDRALVAAIQLPLAVVPPWLILPEVNNLRQPLTNEHSHGIILASR